jgi:voltage-gated potassium channel
MNKQRNLLVELVSMCRRRRFTLVVTAVVLLAIVQPLMSELFHTPLLFQVVFTLLNVAVMLLVFENDRHRVLAFSLGVTAILGVWIGLELEPADGRRVLMGSYLLAAGFFGFALYGILHGILSTPISQDALYGGVCGYLILGITWGFLYTAVEAGSAGSFRSSITEVNSTSPKDLDRATLTYFSFITLSGVGYGDITPTTPLTQKMTLLAALSGQFYFAILVTGLVERRFVTSLRDSMSRDKTRD